MLNPAVIQIVHSVDVKPEISTEATVYAPSGHVYFINKNPDFITFARSMYQAEKEKNDWIRRYENFYKGLRYWRERAMIK